MQPSTIIHYSSKDDSYDVIDMDRTEFPRGGGATKKNKRIGGLDLRQDHFLFFGRSPLPQTESVLKNQKGKCARK